jgi:DNA-3-methyladenine glycosylase II
MTAASFTPAGPFSLTSSMRFLEGFTAASYDHAADGELRLAFPADDAVSVIGCAVRQKEAADGKPGTVSAEFTVHTGGEATRPAARTAAGKAARAQLQRFRRLRDNGEPPPHCGSCRSDPATEVVARGVQHGMSV